MMEYIRGLQGLKEKHRGAAIKVGSFDGIHLGHGALIASTCGIAKQLAKPAMMRNWTKMKVAPRAISLRGAMLRKNQATIPITAYPNKISPNQIR